MLSKDSLNENNKVYQTELDRIVYGNNIGGLRTKYNGEVYQEGKQVEELEYYEFYMSALKDNDCSPPYIENEKECISPDLIKKYQYDIPLIMCKIGVQPQICKDNDDFINTNFEGFD